MVDTHEEGDVVAGRKNDFKHASKLQPAEQKAQESPVLATLIVALLSCREVVVSRRREEHHTSVDIRRPLALMPGGAPEGGEGLPRGCSAIGRPCLAYQACNCAVMARCRSAADMCAC